LKGIHEQAAKLVLNYWTSAAGRILVELLDEAGKPVRSREPLMPLSPPFAG